MATDVYTIPLKKTINNKPRRGRAKKAIRAVKNFLKKHRRLNEENIAVSKEVNEKIWENGMQGIPRKIEVQLKEIEGKTFVFLKEGKELKEKEKEIKEKKKEEKKAKEEKEKQTEEEKKAKEEKEKQTEEEKKAEEEKKRKLEEKRQKEKDAQKIEIKRKTKE